MRVIPAIDVIDGKCVRLTEGDFSQCKEYNQSPVEVAHQVEEAGFSHLHVVDLDGARKGAIQNLSVVEDICSATSLAVDFGGGISARDDVAQLFGAGVVQVTAGTVAAKQPEMVAQWIAEFGSEAIIIGADARDGRIAVRGWQETTSLSLEAYVDGWVAQGARYVVCTDIGRDGKLAGAAVDLYSRLVEQFPSVRVIASGGVGSLADLHALRAVGVHGAIVGKAFYEGALSLVDVAREFAC